MSAVIPIPTSKNIDIHEISQEAHTENENWQPEVELSDLTQEQQTRVRKLLLEQCDVFSKNSSDTGDISDFQMAIKFSDRTPIKEFYWLIPQKLYEKVKNYLYDLITNE